jgi:hypothetical protein
VKRLRRQSPEFQAQCDKALVDGGLTVAEAAHARAVEGWEEPIFHAGQIVGTRHRFSEGLLKAKAAAAKAAAEAGDGGSAQPFFLRSRGQVIPAATQAEIDEELMRRLDAMAQIIKQEEARDRQGWADDMKAKGWAP